MGTIQNRNAFSFCLIYRRESGVGIQLVEPGRVVLENKKMYRESFLGK